MLPVGRGRGSRRGAPALPWALSPWLSCVRACGFFPRDLSPPRSRGVLRMETQVLVRKAEKLKGSRGSPGSAASPRLGVGRGAHMPSGAPRACVPGACHPPGHGRPLPTRPSGGFTLPTDSEPLAASHREGALLGTWRSGWSELGAQGDALCLPNSLQKCLFSFLLKG